MWKNYTLISLIFVLSKLFEIIVYKKMIDFLSVLTLLANIYHSVDCIRPLWMWYTLILKRPLIQYHTMSCFWSCGPWEL